MLQPADVIEQLPYLRRMARAWTRNRANADDLVQNCLERAWAHQGQFMPGTNLRAWLLTIMHNHFIDDVRRDIRARENSDAAQTFIGGRFTPGNQELALELSDLRAALARLPIEQYTTLILVTLEDMNYEQAAKITNVPIGTIRSRLSRARATLKSQLWGEIPNEPSNALKLRRRRRPPAPADTWRNATLNSMK